MGGSIVPTTNPLLSVTEPGLDYAADLITSTGHTPMNSIKLSDLLLAPNFFFFYSQRDSGYRLVRRTVVSGACLI